MQQDREGATAVESRPLPLQEIKKKITGGVTKLSSRKTLVLKDLTVQKESSCPPEVPQDCIRFVCISDTHSQVEEHHNFLSQVPPGDVLLHAGDFTLYGDVEEIDAFNQFLEKLPHPIKLVIPGNHETTLDPRGFAHDIPGLRRHLGLPPCNDAASPHNYKDVRQALTRRITNAVLLTDNSVQLCGIKIYGYPWVPRHGALGFGLKRDKDLEASSRQIPDDVDILLSHGPAKGFGDLTSSGKRAGCVHLASNILDRIKPKLVISGHIHEGYGVFTSGETAFINAAVCNRGYRPKQPPIVVDYKIPEPYTRDDLLKLTHNDLELIYEIKKMLLASSKPSPSNTEATDSPPQPQPPLPPPLPPKCKHKVTVLSEPPKQSSGPYDTLSNETTVI